MAHAPSPLAALVGGAALVACLFAAPGFGRATASPPSHVTLAAVRTDVDTPGAEVLAWPPDAWKIRRTSRRARRKAYSVTRRSAGKTMAARRSRTAKRRRNTLQGVRNSRALKSKARKARRRRNSRRPH